MKKLEPFYLLSLNSTKEITDLALNRWLRIASIQGYFSNFFPYTNIIDYYASHDEVQLRLEKLENIFNEDYFFISEEEEDTQFYSLSFLPENKMEKLIFIFDLFKFLKTDFQMQIWDLNTTEKVTGLELNYLESFEVLFELATSFHYVEIENKQGWLHLHGLEKFGFPNLEAFGVYEEEVESYQNIFREIVQQRLGIDLPLSALASTIKVATRGEYFPQLDLVYRNLCQNHPGDYEVVIKS